ncbi:MAG: C39 family peptidase [Lachnospiraceae bacterium]
MKKRISIIMLLTISVLMTGCEELHKKPLAYIETNADDRQSETSETETKKKKETEPETEAVEVVEQGSLETERPETETESETEEDKTEDATPEGELPVLEKTDKTSEEIEMENILQNPELPTGCESVALTMVLKYLGFDLEKTTIADDYLVFADRNFAMGYIGNPHTEDGAGIFAPGLVKTANNFLEAQESEKRGFDISDTDFEDLYNYVAAGIPIIIWNTMYLEKPVPTDEVCEFEGKTYRWFRNEHCMVMCGFNKENGTVLIQDPLDGLVERDAETFAKYYEELGKNAMIIH